MITIDGAPNTQQAVKTQPGPVGLQFAKAVLMKSKHSNLVVLATHSDGVSMTGTVVVADGIHEIGFYAINWDHSAFQSPTGFQVSIQQ